MNRFAEKVILVTGGTSGIGRATAVAFAAEGACVVIAARRATEGADVEREIQSAGGKARFIRTDVTDEGSVAEMVRLTIAEFGRLDCAFNNAGTAGRATVRMVDQSEDDWDAVLDVNLKGVWRCMKHEIPALLNNGGGCIVNMSSIFGLVGSNWGISPYVASKHAVIGLGRAAAMEYARQGIRINTVCPGLTHSEMLDRGLSAAPERFARMIDAHVPMNRIANASEIARAVLWLCSEEASFVTGQAWAVDGGWTTG